MSDTHAGVVVSVCLSVFTALVASSSLCSVTHDCARSQTCIDLKDGWCSFSKGYTSFNSSTPAKLLVSLERGVCPWGERQNVIDGKLVCLRQRSFPSALNTEIMNPGAPTYHQTYCGKWLDSHGPINGRYWSLFDANAVSQDVHYAISSKYKVRNAVTNAGKFRNACVRMVTSNAGGPAGQLAYQHLKELLPVPATREQLITIAGILPAHYCDAPSMIGVTHRSHGNAELSINITEGTSLTASEVSQGLYTVGESRHVAAEAEEFASALRTSSALVALREDIELYIAGSVRGTVLDGTTSTYAVYNANSQHLARFLATAGSKGLKAAHSYLLGLAATCSYAVRGVVTGELGLSKSLVAEDSIDPYQELGDTATLGRLPPSRGGDHVESISPARMLKATSSGWSALRGRSTIANAHRLSAASVCTRAMRAAFPDELDSSVFNHLVTMRLYNRLETMTTVIREAVRVTVLGPIMAPLFANPSELADRVATSVMRVAGAPRNTWAGRASPMLVPGFTSSDGSLVMLLKQARAVYNDRIGLAMSGAGIKQYPPLMASSSRNGYMLFQSGVGMLLPGILVPPFADADYDDASLYSRIGYVIAHEFAHITAAVAWNEIPVSQFLHNLGYAQSEYTEAIADVIAVSALLNAGVVDNNTMCASVSQLWCASAGDDRRIMFDIPATGSHPPANARGDRLCSYISQHYR